METTRRTFLGVAAALFASTASAAPASVQHITLYGDGLHDDAAALNALFAGEAVIFDGNILQMVETERFALPVAEYKIGSPIMAGKGKIDINGSTLVAADDFKGKSMFIVAQACDLRVTFCEIHTGPLSPTSMLFGPW